MEDAVRKDLSLVTGANAPGVLITFEGGDGAGKSTHIRFLAQVLESLGFSVLMVREPGGTALGERVRSIVLDPDITDLSDQAELLLYETARAQLVAQVIKPALADGAIVLCDRFTDSTVAYQGYGRGIDCSFIAELNDFATQGIRPDRTVVMVCPDRDEKQRRVDDRSELDRLEMAGYDFHSRVNEAFNRLPEEQPERVRLVETQDAPSKTAMHLFEVLSDIFPWLADGSLDIPSQLAVFDSEQGFAS